MNQLNMKTVAKRMSLLALSGAFVVGIAACGGGGSSSSSTSGVFDSTGAAIKGPLDGATVSVMDVLGNSVNIVSGGETKKDGTGTYSASLSGVSDDSFPLIWKFSGGIDSVTGAAPTMDVETIAANKTVTTVNALPQTTMLVAAARAKAEARGGVVKISLMDIGDATKAISDSFGMGSSIDLSTLLRGDAAVMKDNKAAIVQAAEATGEVIRRMTVSLSGSETVDATDMGKVLAAMAQDAAKVTVAPVTFKNSKATVATVDALTFQAQLFVKKAEVQRDMVQGVLEVVGSQGKKVILNDKLNELKLAPVILGTAFLNEASANAVAAAGVLKKLNMTKLADAYTAFQETVEEAVGVAGAVAVDMGTLQKDINKSIGKKLGLDCDASPDNCSAVTISKRTTDEQKLADDATKVAAKDGKTFTKDVLDGIVKELKVKTDKLKFQVSAGSIRIMDGASEISPSATPAVTSGVLSANFAQALSASNLSKVIDGTGGTAPSLRFSVSSQPKGQTPVIPVGEGTAAVTILLKDGDSEARSINHQRQLSVAFSVNWTSDGKKLTVTTPSTGKATASYYTAAAAIGATPTVVIMNNKVMENVMFSSGDATTQSSVEVKIANLFNTGALATPLNAVKVAGSYFYKITIIGLPLALKTSSETHVGTPVVTDMHSVQGTFSVQN